MPVWLNRTDKTLLRSVASADLPESQANYIEEPNLSAVAGQPVRYWVITGDVISLADQATRDTIDAALLAVVRDDLAGQIDQVETFMRAFALILLDEFNATALKINEILDAIDAGNNAAQIKSNIAAVADRPIRTIAQLKTALRSKLDT